MMWYWHDGLSWWGFLGMTISMVVFWGLVIWGVVALIRYSGSPGTRRGASDQSSATPESILAERFARGEFDEREYIHKRDVLQSTGTVTGHANSQETAGERDVETAVR